MKVFLVDIYNVLYESNAAACKIVYASTKFDKTLALCFQANKMALKEQADDPVSFILLDKTHGQEIMSLHCEASSPEMKQNWLTHIKNILELQSKIIISKCL